MNERDTAYSAPDVESKSVSAGVLPVLSSSYLAMLLSLIKGVIVPRILGPTLQGVVSVVNLVVGYAAHSHIGLVHGMNKEMPRLLGQGREEEAHRVKDAAVSAAMVLAAIAGLVPIGYGLICHRDLGAPTVTGLVFSAGMVVAAQAALLYYSLLRTYKQFRLVGVLGAVSAILDFVLIIGLTWIGSRLEQTWSVYGTLLALLIKNMVVWLLYAVVTRYWFRFTIDWPRLWRLLRTGLPISGINFAEQLLRTIDRVVIVKLLGTPALGLYAVGGMAANLVYNIPRSVGWVLFPHFLEASAGGNQKHTLHDQMLNFTLFLAAVIPALAGAMYILTPAIIQLILERFVPGVPAARAQLAGVALLSLTVPAGVQLVALNKEWWISLARVVTALFIGGGTVCLIRDGGGITEVAWWMATGIAVYSPGLVLMALLAYGVSWERAAGRVLVRLLPPGYCAGAVLLAERVAREICGTDQAAPAYALTAVLVYVIVLLPLLWWADRRFKLRQRLPGWRRRGSP